MPLLSAGKESRTTRWVRLSVANLAWVGQLGLDLLFPARCRCCQTDLQDPQPKRAEFCPGCSQLLAAKSWSGCDRCGATYGTAVGPSKACPACRSTRLEFDGAVALGTYDGLLREVVLRMKRPGTDELSVAVGRLLAERRADIISRFRGELLVPVPMYLRRRLVRGANSPEMVARGVGAVLGVAVGRGVLVQCRKTLPQHELAPRERFRNVRGAFRVRRRSGVVGKRVLLVDDILTTGATCSAAAAALKQAGAREVFALIVARAQHPPTT